MSNIKRFTPELKQICGQLTSSPRPAVGVLGDFCLDQYLYIDRTLDEPSVETGLTAYQVRRKELYPGAAGTISNNLAALGAKVSCFGLCGDDGEGFELLRALKKIGADTTGIVQSGKMVTNTYTKPMRQNEVGTWTELNRLDLRNSKPAPAELIGAVKRHLANAISQLDALVISDQFTYEAGSVLNDDLRQFLATLAAKNPDRFFLVDSRSFCEHYQGMMVKCNASEILDARRRLDGEENNREVTVLPDADTDESALYEAGTRLSQRNQQPVLVTCGKYGSILFHKGEAVRIPGFIVEPPIDICGAGDATNAGLAFCRGKGLDLASAAFCAGAVSSITIQQIGVTGTATMEQLIARITE